MGGRKSDEDDEVVKLRQEIDEIFKEIQPIVGRFKREGGGFRGPVQPQVDEYTRIFGNPIFTQSGSTFTGSRWLERPEILEIIAAGERDAATLEEGSMSGEEQAQAPPDDFPSENEAPERSADFKEILPTPPLFTQKMDSRLREGNISKAVQQYYLNASRSDSINSPGQDGSASLLMRVLKDDVQKDRRCERRDSWKAGAVLGTGAFGKVILWERVLEDGSTVRLAAKDTSVDKSYFLGYNIEGQLVRRLNEAACKNVIKILDWVYIPASSARPTGDSDAGFRMCFEYAEYGDLGNVIDWYDKHSLVLPEAFVWHVFKSIANALCYCRYGTNAPEANRPKQGWDQIIHGDVKPDNILLTGSDDMENRLYPCLKLADFGFAYTIGDPVSEVRAYKSTFTYGTHSFQAPEISRAARRNGKIGPKDLHGSHSDVYSLGTLIREMCALSNRHFAQELLFRGSEPPKYYSDGLTQLYQKCCSRNPTDRPQIYDLYLETTAQAAIYKAQAYAEASRAPAHTDEACKVFHSQVIWSKQTQRLYENSLNFREKYHAANSDGLVENSNSPSRGKAINDVEDTGPLEYHPSGASIREKKFATTLPGLTTTIVDTPEIPLDEDPSSKRQSTNVPISKRKSQTALPGIAKSSPKTRAIKSQGELVRISTRARQIGSRGSV